MVLPQANRFWRFPVAVNNRTYGQIDILVMELHGNIYVSVEVQSGRKRKTVQRL